MNKETLIHNSILIRLTKEFHPHGIFWRQNAGKVKTHTGAFVSLGPPGIADIVGTLYGLSVFVEVKTDEGRQRKAQADFQKSVEKAGGFYIIARTPDEAINLIKANQRIQGLSI